MAEQKYTNFITMLINRTKAKTTKWYYLDSNVKLYSGMNWARSHYFDALLGNQKPEPDFDIEDSFYTNDNGVYIILLVQGSQPANLYVVPETFKKIVCLTAEEYGEHITRLLNLVQSQFPNAEAFIDEFLQKNGIDHITEV